MWLQQGDLFLETLNGVYTGPAVINKVDNTCTIIDIAIPAPANVHEKHKEKVIKYTDLVAEIKQVWKEHKEKVIKYTDLVAEIKQVWKVQSVEIIPIIIGATGEIPSELDTSLNRIGLGATGEIPSELDTSLNRIGLPAKGTSEIFPLCSSKKKSVQPAVYIRKDGGDGGGSTST
ncbi:hypothetical protein QE152_g21841 [Popillia japonica]|uniref:Uncharacterized protein n=1 Tax=Popillia japonica TaxID=7064 RepID=A0AAW1KN32_POPJA